MKQKQAKKLYDVDSKTHTNGSLYIKEYPIEMSDAELHSMFEAFGPIINRSFKRDPSNGRTWGFVHFENP